MIRFHDQNRIRMDADIRQEILGEIMYSMGHQGQRCRVENTILLPGFGRSYGETWVLRQGKYCIVFTNGWLVQGNDPDIRDMLRA